MVYSAFPGKQVVQEAIEQSELTKRDKSTALDTINLIKVKKNGVIKGRMCADGSKEQYFLKEYALEAVISTLLVDVLLDVAIFDIHGTYLHTPMPDE